MSNKLSTTNWIVLSFVLLLSACAHKNQQKKTSQLPSKDWNSVKSWSFTGKMAINDGQQNGTGRVQWQVTNDKTQAQFKAPLGQGSWHLIAEKDHAKLLSSDKPESTAQSAQQLLSEALGWDFPWDKLHYWLRGQQKHKHLHSLKQPIDAFEDAGWQIEYDQWTQTAMGLLPKKIKATQAPYSIKLFIYKWEFE